MRQYLTMLEQVMAGERKTTRAGETVGVFGCQNRYDLNEGFPLLTTKKMFLKGIIHELLWFISGNTNVGYLQQNKVKIWDAWATKAQCAKFGREEGDLGPIYGHQWRNFGGTKVRASSPMTDLRGAPRYLPDGVDQLDWVVKEIKANPDSRRLIVTGWNPAEADQVALPPCHTMFQFYVCNGKLSCQLYQRSADIFLGVPFNIASYALLTMLVAQQCDLEVGEFVHTFGDLHLYVDHMEQAKEQLSREPLELPKMVIERAPSLFAYQREDFQLKDYECHPSIKAKVSV